MPTCQSPNCQNDAQVKITRPHIIPLLCDYGPSNFICELHKLQAIKIAHKIDVKLHIKKLV